MLVLSRRKRQAIVIGDITVTVLRIDGDRVKIGIDAPEDVEIWRDEILNKKGICDGDRVS